MWALVIFFIIVAIMVYFIGYSAGLDKGRQELYRKQKDRYKKERKRKTI